MGACSSSLQSLKDKKAYYSLTPLSLITRGLEGEGLSHRALLSALTVMAVSFTILAVPILCIAAGLPGSNGQFDARSLTKGMGKGMLDVNGDSENEPLNDTVATQWAATIFAGSLALIAIIVVLMVVSMFRRQSKEGGK